MSASSGYFPPSSQQNNAPQPVQVNDAVHHFMNRHQVLDEVEHQYQAPTSPVFHDSLGNLDEATFRAFHPVVGGLLQDFITMTCILIYYDAVIQSWPNSQALDGLALQAIDMILQAHLRDSRIVRETCKFSLFI